MFYENYTLNLKLKEERKLQFHSGPTNAFVHAQILYTKYQLVCFKMNTSKLCSRKRTANRRFKLRYNHAHEDAFYATLVQFHGLSANFSHFWITFSVLINSVSDWWKFCMALFILIFIPILCTNMRLFYF